MLNSTVGMNYRIPCHIRSWAVALKNEIFFLLKNLNGRNQLFQFNSIVEHELGSTFLPRWVVWALGGYLYSFTWGEDWLTPIHKFHMFFVWILSGLQNPWTCIPFDRFEVKISILVIQYCICSLCVQIKISMHIHFSNVYWSGSATFKTIDIPHANTNTNLMWMFLYKIFFWNWHCC